MIFIIKSLKIEGLHLTYLLYQNKFINQIFFPPFMLTPLSLLLSHFTSFPHLSPLLLNLRATLDLLFLLLFTSESYIS